MYKWLGHSFHAFNCYYVRKKKTLKNNNSEFKFLYLHMYIYIFEGLYNYILVFKNIYIYKEVLAQASFTFF